MTRRMMLDVESVGLHGEGFAYGYVIEEDEPGRPLSFRRVGEGFAIANPDTAIGERRDWEWLKAHVFPWINAMSPEFPPEGADATPRPDPTTGAIVTLCSGPIQLRQRFWMLWAEERARGTQLWADVSWPVEAGFLSACVRAYPGRKFEGPYPLLDVATLWEMYFGMSAPLTRVPSELPEHHPLLDARHSMRKLRLCEERIGEGCG